MSLEQQVADAKDKLNAHLQEIIKWHFSPETGCSFWLDWAAKADFNPLEDVKTVEDLT